MGLSSFHLSWEAIVWSLLHTTKGMNMSARIWTQSVPIWMPTVRSNKQSSIMKISVSENILVESGCFSSIKKICSFLKQGMCSYVSHSFIWNTVEATVICLCFLVGNSCVGKSNILMLLLDILKFSESIPWIANVKVSLSAFDSWYNRY